MAVAILSYSKQYFLDVKQSLEQMNAREDGRGVYVKDKLGR